MKNYYEILEINETASTEVIKASYKALMKKYHPDNYDNRNNDVAHEKVIQINEAFEVLSNEDKRKQYDLEYRSEQHSSFTKYNSTSHEREKSNAKYDIPKEKPPKEQEFNQEEPERNSSCLGTIVKWIIILSIFSYIAKGCGLLEEDDKNINSSSVTVQEENKEVTSKQENSPTKSNKITQVIDEKNREIYYFPNRDILITELNQLEEEKAPIYSVKDSKEWFGTKVTYSLDEENDLEPKFIYRGELKDGKPHGIGHLLEKVRSSSGITYVHYYMGWFKEGVKYKYGMEYHIPSDDQLSKLNRIYSEAIINEYEERDEILPDTIWDDIEGDALYDLNYLLYEGEYDKEGLYSGRGNYYDHIFWEYNDVIGTNYEALNQVYVQTGNFKEGKMHGYGVIYSDNGEILYKGQWEKGDYK